MINFRENVFWENKHRNLKFHVKKLFNANNHAEDGSIAGSKLERWLEGISQLTSILKEAEQKSLKVRAVGGGWSLSSVAQTSDFFVNTQPQDVITVGLRPENVLQGFDASKLVLSQGGASIFQINQELDKKNLSLSTSGASDGQTIAGAISTGTHGSAYKFGSIQDCVLGLHIIVSSTKQFWIEGAKKVLSDELLDRLAPDATRVNDDEIFNAALVSFGSFGIIHGVLLQAEEVYTLKLYQHFEPWDVVRRSVNGPNNFDRLGLAPDPYHFEVVINPFVVENVVVKAMYKISGRPISPAPIPSVDELGLGADVLYSIGKIANKIPTGVKALMKLLQKFIVNNYAVKEGDEYLPYQFFSGGQTGFNAAGMSAEIGFDASQATVVVDTILNLVKDLPLGGVIALRYVKESKATLAFTKFPITCTIEMPAILSNVTQQFYDALWLKLEQQGILFTFHWGQCNNLNALNVRQKYGNGKVNAWLEARSKILSTDEERFRFSNTFLQQCQLG